MFESSKACFFISFARAAIGTASGMISDSCTIADDILTPRSDCTFRTDVGDYHTDDDNDDVGNAHCSPNAGDVHDEAHTEFGWPPQKDRVQHQDSYEAQAPPDSWWTTHYNGRHENGNVGWSFGNGGARSKNQTLQARFDKCLKRTPALIVGLAECDALTESVLRAPGEPGVDHNDADGIAQTLARRSHEYITIRGSEQYSILLAVRKRFGCGCGGLKLLEFIRKPEGTYQTQRGKRKAFTRAMIVEVTHPNVGFIGTSHVVMVVHLHCTVARNMKGKKENKNQFIHWMREKVKEHNVKVIMGDFNMAFFEVTDWIRSIQKGGEEMPIDLAAWYGWKNFDGEGCSDSCGIWLVNSPGLYKLPEGRDSECVNDSVTSEMSLLVRATPVQTRVRTDAGGWSRWTKNGGPGQALHKYQPETYASQRHTTTGARVRIPPLTQIRNTLRPSAQSADVLKTFKPRERTPSGSKEFIRVKQIPLHYESFCHETEGPQNGAHFPLCAMTTNNSLRPPRKIWQRHLWNEEKRRADEDGRWRTRDAHTHGTAVAVRASSTYHDFEPKKVHLNSWEFWKENANWSANQWKNDRRDDHRWRGSSSDHGWKEYDGWWSTQRRSDKPDEQQKRDWCNDEYKHKSSSTKSPPPSWPPPPPPQEVEAPRPVLRPPPQAVTSPVPSPSLIPPCMGQSLYDAALHSPSSGLILPDLLPGVDGDTVVQVNYLRSGISYAKQTYIQNQDGTSMIVESFPMCALQPYSGAQWTAEETHVQTSRTMTPSRATD